MKKVMEQYSCIAIALALWGATQTTYGQNGVNNYVYALAADSSDNVYAGGDFDMAGNDVASGIAGWNADTQAWSPLYEYPPPYNGQGVAGTPSAIVIGEDGNIYVGGEFWSAGSQSVQNFAVWSPSQTNWINVNNTTVGGDGGIPNGAYVNGIAMSGDTMYVVGSFLSVGGGYGVSATNIAAWNISSATWANVGPAPPVNIPYTIVTPDGVNFYVGGSSTVVHGTLSDGEIKWQVMDPNVSGDIYAIAITPGGQIFIGGYFKINGGQAALAEWNGTNFVQFTDSSGGTVLPGTVSALSIYNGNLIVGGAFQIQQQTSPYYYLQNIAELDLSSDSWSSVLGGSDNYPNGSINALATQGSGSSAVLYVGGEFTTAGDNVSADHIAAWNPTSGWLALP